MLIQRLQGDNVCCNDQSQFPCSDGCCGDVNNEYCCQVLTAEEYVLACEMYSAKELNELMEADHPPFESPAGTAIHPMVSDQPTTVHDRPGGLAVFSMEHHS
ncbi:hypothetical protein ACOMHN_044794 [Nucella lapillus]